VTRRGRRGDDAQAVLETALVIPILLFLICNFIAVMVQVTVQQQLNSATALAAQSRFQAPENAVDAAGTRCCGAQGVTLVTAGLPTGCRYAAESFYGTMTTYTGLLHWQTATLCTSGGDSGSATTQPAPPVAYPGSPANAEVSCDIGSLKAGSVVVPGYRDRTLNPPSGLDVVTCSASASLDFANTPLAWGVFWTPTLHAHVGAATANLRHVEYFHDYQRIDRLLFDGALDAHGGVLTPDPGQPGLGVQLRAADAQQYRRS